MIEKIIPGCWIEVEGYGEAVCTNITIANRFTDGEKGICSCGNFICIIYSFRYKATRCFDGKIIWVENGASEEKIKYLKGPDDLSLNVLKLSGPYGEG